MTADQEAMKELERARAKFGRFNSAHEGYAVLLEEVEELKREVFWGPSLFPPSVLYDSAENYKRLRSDERIRLMRAEAVQVAAMALRFIEDVCDAEESTNA